MLSEAVKAQLPIRAWSGSAHIGSSLLCFEARLSAILQESLALCIQMRVIPPMTRVEASQPRMFCSAMPRKSLQMMPLASLEAIRYDCIPLH